MPLIIKDYTWEETPSTVAVSVPLKGVKKEKVDIFSTDDYLKVSFPPYLFEVFLHKAVIEDQCTAYIDSGMVLFKLVKEEVELWGKLCSDIMDDKKKMTARREEVLTRAQQKAEEAIQNRHKKHRENEKHALNKAMQLDQEERERIASIQEEERKRATEELEKWKQQQRKDAEREQQRLEKEAVERQNELTEERKIQRMKEKEARNTNIFENDAKANGSDVRESGKIEVTFTPRVFPTAMRESTKHLEDEWLKKQAEARRVADIEDQDLTEEERNPMFMKEKGDNFFKNGDFYAAINAYTHAIRLSRSKMPSLFSNRAACHLKVRNLIKSVEDSSKVFKTPYTLQKMRDQTQQTAEAIELLTPPVPQNAKSRCKAHIRRGTAFCELELYVEGLQDYDAALKIEPDNELIKMDADKIRKIIQGTTGNSS